MPDLSRPVHWRRRTADLFLLIFLILLPMRAAAQEEGVIFTVHPGDNYRVIEKFNLSQYRNGQYQGHIYRENRGIYDSTSSGGNLFKVNGTVYHLEEKTKDGFKTASAVTSSENVTYTLNSRGTMLVPGSAYPRLRSFPTFPKEAVIPGDKWEGGLEVVVTAPDGSERAVLPQYCEYTYMGEEVWEGRDVYVIKAQYAVRYRQGRSPAADTFLRALSGKHVVSLMIDIETMEFLLMKDIMEEEYQYLDGSSLREKGFLLTFYKGIELLDRPGLRKDVETVLADQLKDSFEEKGESLTDQISVEERDEGLALNLKNLHFKADEAVILPEDRPLLDTIAEVLKKVPDRTFLVKGHTADIGTMESQIILSQERARTIVEELSSRGIEADRFLFTGMGGLMPLGDNATDEGRRQNRRVEIFILED
ncbi:MULTISPECIES: OmpA family protein [unclassified Oceanispirochaeta]|uniref:OmpA family protein n=1 Tax=unclassified Oceanispirochaeta TaxID=2635722 RepID=UPI000E096C9A|nr:OmpA family protein [Oceanispirochaeta sp. M1]MBF9016220.1 OmpA family protein [Oceanispirochaeta sp. M2]NPD72682.1 OmpA family protein [Oceanispirochaeta sp. M1]RDG31832.1 OmpA family protein [Oceanispirochaeta sp. M1]